MKTHFSLTEWGETPNYFHNKQEIIFDRKELKRIVEALEEVTAHSSAELNLDVQIADKLREMLRVSARNTLTES